MMRKKVTYFGGKIAPLLKNLGVPKKKKKETEGEQRSHYGNKEELNN